MRVDTVLRVDEVGELPLLLLLRLAGGGPASSVLASTDEGAVKMNLKA